MPRRAATEVQALIAHVLAACRRVWIVAAAFSLAINLLLLSVPLYMLQLFDRVLMSRSIDTLLLLSAIAGLAVLSLALLDVIRGLIFARLGAWVERKLGGYVLAGHVAAAVEHGRIGVQGLRDLAAIRSFLSGAGIVPLLDAPWTPIFIVAIYLLHPLLGLAAAGGAVLLLVLMLCAELANRRPLLRATERAIAITDTAEGSVRNAESIEAMGMMPALIERWQRRQRESLQVQERVGRRMVVVSGVSKFLRLALQIGIYGMGAWLVIANELTAGAMIAAAILMGRALAPLEMAIGGWRGAVGAYGAYRRVRAQLEAAPIARPTMSLPLPSGRLSVEGVAFAFPGQPAPFLKSISFTVEPGGALGVVGPAAAGKSTLARLLVGNLKPQVGHIRLDGAEITSLTQQDRAAAIGYLPQTVELFGGSVRENIARFSEAADESVVEAAQLVGAHEMILRLPRGYDTEVGDGQVALSGAQRQWIALARAAFNRPKLLVLDEPNTALDAEGEAAFVKSLARLKAQGTTVVLIAHRGPALQQVDNLLVLRNGQRMAFGSRRQVVPTLVTPVGDSPAPSVAQAGRDG
jgi:PrtD family type I secretion system ABC transporter